MVTADLNAWFYSSLAQVSAAIIGIIGAVFLTRLAAHQGRTDEMFDETQRAIEGHLSNVTARCGWITSEAALDNNNVASSDREPLAKIAVVCKGLEGQARPEPLKAIQMELKQHRATLKNPWAQTVVVEQLAHLIQAETRLRAFEAQSFPRSLWAVWGLLVWLTLAGVWWPLSALPGLTSGFYSRNAILYAFVVGVGIFEAFLLSELVRLWRKRYAFQWRLPA